jgi:hypothetical protein
MDGALRRMVKERKAGRDCGFPRPKKKFVNEAGVYCVGQATEISASASASASASDVTLPKLGRVKLRGGTVPEGRLQASRVWRDGSRWMLSAQFECARPAPLEPTGVTLGVDLGVATLVTTFDGAGFDEVTAPEHLRKALKRLRRAERMKSRRRTRIGPPACPGPPCWRDPPQGAGSPEGFAAPDFPSADNQGRCAQGQDVERPGHGPESPSRPVRGRCREARLVTFCEYKANWRGRQVEKIDPWFPGSQTCCGGAEIHREMRNLKERMMRCNCGNVMGARPKRRREPLLVSRGAGEPHRKRCNAHGDGKSGAGSGAHR